MKNLFTKGTARIRNSVQAGRAIYDESGIAEPLGSAANRVGRAAGDAFGAMGDALDTAAGRRMYNLVQERLDLQSRYNDILAYKLEEALKRIAALEAKLLEKGA